MFSLELIHASPSTSPFQRAFSSAPTFYALKPPVAGDNGWHREFDPLGYHISSTAKIGLELYTRLSITLYVAAVLSNVLPP